MNPEKELDEQIEKLEQIDMDASDFGLPELDLTTKGRQIGSTTMILETLSSYDGYGSHIPIHQEVVIENYTPNLECPPLHSGSTHRAFPLTTIVEYEQLGIDGYSYFPRPPQISMTVRCPQCRGTLNVLVTSHAGQFQPDPCCHCLCGAQLVIAMEY